MEDTKLQRKKRCLKRYPLRIKTKDSSKHHQLHQWIKWQECYYHKQKHILLFPITLKTNLLKLNQLLTSKVVSYIKPIEWS